MAEKVPLKLFDFKRALQTTRGEDGLPWGDWSTFQNVRVDRESLRRRKGWARVAQLGNDNAALDFVAANSERIDIPLNASHFTLGERWTIDALIEPDVVTGTNPILTIGTSTQSIALDINSSNARLRVWDEDTTADTITGSSTLTVDTVYWLRAVRDGTSLTLYVDNSSEGTATMAAGKAMETPAGNMHIGYDGTNYYDGTIDYVRIFSYARTLPDGLTRFPDPIADGVLADWPMEVTNTLVKDRSRYGNTGQAINTPTSTTALCRAHAPMQGIQSYKNRSGDGRILLVGGGRIYDVEVR